MNKLFRPAVFPALLAVPPAGHQEPSWMIEGGWIELWAPRRPKWRAICETWYDVACELHKGPPKTIYRAIQRGAPHGEHCPVMRTHIITRDPINGGVISLLAM